MSLTCLFTLQVYPMDAIKTRIQIDSDVNPRYRSVADCARQMVAKEGFGSLYRVSHNVYGSLSSAQSSQYFLIFFRVSFHASPEPSRRMLFVF